jgi:hypothetical protein
MCKPMTGGNPQPVSHSHAVGDWPASTSVEVRSDTHVYGVGATVSGPGYPFLTGLVPDVANGRGIAEATRTGAGPVAMLMDGDDGEGELGVRAASIGTFY